MIRTFDLILIGIMAASATVTYQIKHRTDEKVKDLHHIESEIKLEKDTIDLLNADWALLTQPNRLEKLVATYGPELDLQQTDPNQLARENELPMLKSQLPVPSPLPEVAQGRPAKTDSIITGAVKR
ncbi:hypothetical protein NAC44_17915 [Allorhizobium sp. BGMRC 0089]|uniref:cell division protein FtsL n=1 Tax=Allorhizobium sonneratiae TaxID=2934936 RepID=UPI002033D55D|nr:hypothetical protein [Allorhizobium sonneratiae]MCM2294206.1 hypothetical protein [Allorhizobium sonneratiae]